MPYKNEPKGVYCLTFPNGKRYVGIGLSRGGITIRFNSYKNYRCEDQPKLFNALKKYGSENVKYEIILQTDDREKACKVEIQLISLWGLQNDKYGYNISAGGDLTNLGRKFSAEHCKRIGDVRRGKKLRHRTQEEKEHISRVLKGRILRPLDYKHSEETKKKISESNKGKKRTPEQIEKNRQSRIGIPSKRKRYIILQNRITNEIFEGYMHDLCIRFSINKKSISGRGYTREWKIIR